MTANSPSAFLMSATLHGVVIALALLFAYATSQRNSTPPKVLELVAGEGQNFMATEAPALGTPEGIKLAVPKAPEPKPAPPEPVQREVVPVPVPPAPVQKEVTPAPPLPETIPDFKKQIRRDIIKADSKAKQQIARDRAAEKKRLEEEQKRMTKEEFDRANKAKTASSSPTKNSPTKTVKVDAEGIAKGVVGGSTKNKTGGAGGKALVAENGAAMERYFSLLKTEIRLKFEPPPGVSDSLKVDIELRGNADGSLVGAHVTKTSGSAEFDQAVLDAIKRVRMPPRPDKKNETVEFTFTMKERGEG